MQKVGDITNTANDVGEYTDGNPGAGVEPTLIKARWLNVVQRELVNAIVGLGITLDSENDSQLLEALEKLSSETAEWDAIKNKPVTYPSAEHSHSFSSIQQIPPAVLALSRTTSLSEDATLSAVQMGLVQIDANAAARTITLPSATAALGVVDVIVRRSDNSGNRLVVKADGTDRIMFHTHLSATGYPFLVLMGAGDWWHLRSDGAGNWFPIGRFDNTPLGRPVFETTTAFSPGGWAGHNGFIYNRAEWPWVWDHAQASGMLTTEALRAGKEGMWTSGDGVSTFRSPEARGESIRMLDESRGVDASRAAGSWQDGTWLRTVAQEWTGSDIVGGNYFFGNAHAGADGRIANAGPGGVIPPGAVPPSGAGGYNPATTDNGAMAPAEITTSALNNWIRFRSRNIAYPGRIKMI